MKKISPIVMVGLILTITCPILSLSKFDFVQAVANYSYDAFIRIVHQSPKSGSVVIVDLDDASLKKCGQWPWPRYRVGQMTQNILDAGASVVCFDIVFAERDRTSPVVAEQDWREAISPTAKVEGIAEDRRDFDVLFAQVLRGGRTVLGCTIVPSDSPVENMDPELDPSFSSRTDIVTKSKGGQGSLSNSLKQASGVLLPIRVLNEASRVAFFNADPDPDNIVRSNPLVWAYGDHVYPSMALEAVMLHCGIPRCVVTYDAHGVLEMRLKETLLAVDSVGRMTVNYRKIRNDSPVGFSSSFPTYSAADVLEKKFPAKAFAGKIVLIGASATGLKDVKATPVTQDFSGVEVHATLIDNILAGDMLSNPYEFQGLHVICILLLAIFLTFFIARGRSWLSFLVAIGAILLLIKVSLVLLQRFNLVFVPAWEIMSVIIIYPILTMIRFWDEELQKKRVRDMFGTMVSTTVLHYLENHPGSFSLSGQKREATMFFSDVAGFTTISEALGPEQLSNLLNGYLSPMTDIIMERRGYVDKYAGDGIMAEWGVPYPVPDHAAQACLAALEQQDKLAELRPILKEKFGKEIQVRMGLNSGTVTAGNMGSDKRFQYTVMGDAVNQAARYEPANKDYGTLIIIGETTYEEAKAVIEARLLDKLTVKGKTKPICVYELLARKGQLSAEKRKVVDLYEKALALHWERKWDESLACMNLALELDPGDGPSATLRKRIIEYQKTPPPATWAGEYVRKAKD